MNFSRMIWEILSYVNKDNQLFLVMAKDLYQINIDESSYKVLAEGINRDNFVVSDTNAHAAWIVSEGENAGTDTDDGF